MGSVATAVLTALLVIVVVISVKSYFAAGINRDAFSRRNAQIAAGSKVYRTCSSFYGDICSACAECYGISLSRGNMLYSRIHGTGLIA